MKSIQEILKNTITIKEREKIAREKKREADHLKSTTKTGSGEKPDRLKIYNRYMKEYGQEPKTLREYLKDKETFDREIGLAEYEIYCTQEYINEVFGVEIETKDAARISDSIFKSYYEEGNDDLEHVKYIYPIILLAVKNAHESTETKLLQARQTLLEIGIDEYDIPLELDAVIYIRENYDKNQKKRAIKEILLELFPQINNEIILDQIVTNALQ